MDLIFYKNKTQGFDEKRRTLAVYKKMAESKIFLSVHSFIDALNVIETKKHLQPHRLNNSITLTKFSICIFTEIIE